MKTILSFVLALSATAALAADPTIPNVTKKTVHGDGGPRYRTVMTCTIDADAVEIVNTGGVVGLSKQSKKVSWTKSVPNVAKLETLLTAASKGQIVNAKCLPPLGSPTTTYSGVYKTVKSNNKKNVQIGSNPCRYINTANEAKTLMTFIEANCP